MLTARGCQQRRERLWQQLRPAPDSDHIRLGDPIHLAYLASFHVDPFTFSGGFGGYLILRQDGHAKLIHDNRTPKNALAMTHVEEKSLVPWYDGQSPGQGPRRLVLLQDVNPSQSGFRIHDQPGDPYAATLINTLAEMRRRKDADEIELLKKCCRCGEAGHAWALENVAVGMTELDVYNGISAACSNEAGFPVVVYGDFVVCTGPDRRGGPPTSRILEAGDMLILDFSVILGGYRSDVTNTLVVGGEPNSRQKELYDLCTQAMTAGEKELRAGQACQTVYDSVRGVFEKAGVADHFPHHAGHGLGLGHPEAPFLVRNSTETLMAGDVVTLEPGLYIPDEGGIRIEHNYLITETGYERSSNHTIALG